LNYTDQSVRMRTYTNSRAKLLHAAEQVVMEVGAAHLTLDAVARKAGVSKGGLIHNFPTKDALLQAMVVQLLAAWKERYEQAAHELPNSPASKLKARLLAKLHADERSRRVSSAVLAVAANQPQLLEPVRAHICQVHQALVESGLDFNLAVLLLLAADGLYMQELLGLSCFSARQRKSIVEHLLRMADGTVRRR